ncbi:hypothetical protein QBC44DRAFT_368586 [Cladorrhinum sp. PSN332]|nr:hypothetical protein QBC44DRAFT_368586 [Cladorrhinum sp. PSN332]
MPRSGYETTNMVEAGAAVRPAGPKPPPAAGDGDKKKKGKGGAFAGDKPKGEKKEEKAGDSAADLSPAAAPKKDLLDSSTLADDDHNGSSNDFEELSYVWGGEIRPEDGHNILLDAFLRRLRLPSEDMILWADSICINQNDVKEREEQVDLSEETK